MFFNFCGQPGDSNPQPRVCLVGISGVTTLPSTQLKLPEFGGIKLTIYMI